MSAQQGHFKPHEPLHRLQLLLTVSSRSPSLSPYSTLTTVANGSDKLSILTTGVAAVGLAAAALQERSPYVYNNRYPK
jgi:hypothetical protein